MTNKQVLENNLKKLGFRIGTYNKKIEGLKKPQLKKVIENMEYGSTDILVYLNRKQHIVEVFHVDNEVDFNILTKQVYENRYGRKITN